MNTHNESALKIIQQLSSDPSLGLTENQVQERRVQYGENKLRKKKRKSSFSRFLEQFKDEHILTTDIKRSDHCCFCFGRY